MNLCTETQMTRNTVKLSDREMDVLKRIAEGLRSKEIAEVLFSYHTVHAHRRNIMKKIGQKNMTGCLTKYLKER